MIMDFFVIMSFPIQKSGIYNRQTCELFQALSAAIMGTGDSTPKPLCVKIAPDLFDDEIRAVDITGVSHSSTRHHHKSDRHLESGGLVVCHCDAQPV